MATKQTEHQQGGTPQPGEPGYKPPTDQAAGLQGGGTGQIQQGDSKMRLPPGGAAGTNAGEGQAERDSS